MSEAEIQELRRYLIDLGQRVSRLEGKVMVVLAGGGGLLVTILAAVLAK